MTYCGISLLSTVDRTTSALWPDVPTGGVPQRMSLACDQAGEPAPNVRMTTKAASARASMRFSPRMLCSLTGIACIHPGPRSTLVIAWGAILAKKTKAYNQPDGGAGALNCSPDERSDIRVPNPRFAALTRATCC